MKEKVHISVVTPAYKCEACIVELHRRMSCVLPSITPNYEIIFVEDGSPQKDWDLISGLCEQDPHVRGVKLSRNYGQHYAITAGLDRVRGDWIVVMDCDLQDQPEEIPKLYAKAQEGWSIVMGRRARRKDSLYRRFVSKFFILVYNWLGDIKVDNSVASFSICSRQIIDAVTKCRDRSRNHEPDGWVERLIVDFSGILSKFLHTYLNLFTSGDDLRPRHPGFGAPMGTEYAPIKFHHHC